MRHRTLFTARLLGLAVLGALLLSLGGLMPSAAPAAAAIDPQVYAALSAAPDGQAAFFVYLAGRPAGTAAPALADALAAGAERAGWAGRGAIVAERLQAAARASQAGILDRLARGRVPGRVRSYQPFWIANAIAVTGDRQAAEWLARQPGVTAILPEMKLDPPEPADAGPVTAAAAAGVAPGVGQINADDVWAVYAARGEGAVIGLVDTGVQWDHPALIGHYRGWDGVAADHNYNWWDPARLCGPAGSPPCDNPAWSGHGTHTTGTTSGGEGANEIGVAPAAQWIHAAGCCASNASLLSALQWMLAPTDLNGNNPDPAKRPHVVNNSWGGPGGSLIFDDAIAALAAAGIVPVFSAGNSGAACGTLGSPGDNPAADSGQASLAFNVGAADANDGIAPFSSRGPNPFTGLTGPEVTAPGVNVPSAAMGGGYRTSSGTSMAAPHVAGAIALLISIEPALAGEVAQIEAILRGTAQPITSTQTCGGVSGAQIPNNTFGWGRIDVKAAADFVWHAGEIRGAITDAGAGLPIASAEVAIVRDGKTVTQRTAADGSYRFVAGAGTYQVRAEAFGYAAQTISDVSVVQDAITTQDLSLAVLATGSVSGTVTQSGTSIPVQGATVTLVAAGAGWGTPPRGSAVTGADGAYTIADVPFGAYTARLTSPGFQTLSAAVTVDAAETVDFAPAAVPDYVVRDGGDACSAPFAWIDATVGGTAHNLADDASKAVALPWSFTFYGNAYSTLYINSNGFVSFGSGYNTWHGIMPFEGPPNNQIIGLGDDLNPEGGSQGVIYSKNLGDGRFVVEYHAVEHWPKGDPETFQIILNRNDGTIVVQYQTVSWPDFANAGIENADGSRGILYAYANDRPLRPGLAVKYTPFSGQPPSCASHSIYLPLTLTRS